MSKEFKVPHDLTVFESELGSLPIANSQLNRDELLYQSGWAAAIASQENEGVAVRQGWVWPTTTGVFATLAAGLALMLFSDFSNLENGMVGPGRVALRSHNGRNAEPIPGAGSERVPANSFEGSAFNDRRERIQKILWHRAGQPLTSRSHVNELDWARAVPVDEVGVEFQSNAKTSFELLKEMVPSSGSKSEYRNPVWDWLSKTWGELI